MKMEGYTFYEDGILTDISDKVLLNFEFTVPKGTSDIADSFFSKIPQNFKNVDPIIIEYEDYANLFVLLSKILKGFQNSIKNRAIILKNIILRGPRLTFEQNNNIRDICYDYGLNTLIDLDFRYMPDKNTLTVETPEYKIGNGILYYVGNVEDVLVPEGTIVVDYLTGGNDKGKPNRKVKRIDLPDTVKYISNYAFRKTFNLRYIKLPNNLEYIGKCAFDETALREIEIPASTKKIERYPFGTCKRLKKIIITYKDFEELQTFLLNNMCVRKGFQIDGLDVLGKVELVFLGEKLEQNQRRYVIDSIDNYKIIVSFEEKGKDIVEENVVIDENEEVLEIKENKYGEEVEKLIDQIKLVCDNLPENTKTIIFNKVKTLLNEFDNDAEKLKPKYGKSDSNPLELGTIKYIGSLKPELIANLNAILFSLSYANAQVKFLGRLNDYKKVLDSPVEKIDEGESLLSDIKNIIYLSGYLEEERKNEVLNILSNYIDNTINNISNRIDNILNVDNLTLTNNLDYEMELKLNIDKIYEEIKLETHSIIPYKDMLKELSVESAGLSEGNTLSDLISSTRYVISRIQSEKYKNQLDKELNDILNKHKKIINIYIANKENKQREDIEKSIRLDLQDLLESIKNFSYMDEYINKKVNKEHLLKELNDSLKIIELGSIIKLTEELKLYPITSYVIEISNKLINNRKDINDSELKEIRSEIMNIINKYINILESEKIETLEEYNIFMHNILRELAGVDLNIDIYLYNIEEYRKHIIL